MIELEIDINNEQDILEKFDYRYCYFSEVCSRELCSFFNDLRIDKRKGFDTKQAIIDLGRIAITLNEQDKLIIDLKSKYDNLYEDYKDHISKDLKIIYKYVEENQQLKKKVADFEKLLNLQKEK